MSKKILLLSLGTFALCFALYFTLLYYATYSEGTRTGELIKFSKKGYIFKTWEGELSQGLSGNKIFAFSLLDSENSTIQKLKNLEGRYVKVTYIERYKTFPWWGDTTYFVTDVKEEKSPIFNR
ncbi:6-phosphogluconate dehydrogenase [Flavobacterium columnare]|uniref:6-phosphogluconate dehydrogenase n=1 Tax=Flavobacterium columnare TaxID=996 RepID=UPI0017831D22|nr:6-phosphogluconate dehydrogenase [Flavobacterium columnare]QOG88866.1 6-phosphogluconate dehydrogenase [Flavobacterium columnare]QOG91525.1 6-phosphogluconate dehydrogenase [Flavobacterium columnare]QOG94188.1 6-phosphogluconate dehydrogenase [Flavobacterium columnare]QOG96847.1 6-phosphogluconate dehydrogenase [Flavobacterium columnare]QOG99505.1 6-phosphogluconate dehydrogenase [Flavobacterium columnare]